MLDAPTEGAEVKDPEAEGHFAQVPSTTSLEGTYPIITFRLATTDCVQPLMYHLVRT